MAKNIIEKPPFKFSPSLYSSQNYIGYIVRYKETDQKGRYLYWDQLKYRAEENDSPKIAWWATKLARWQQLKGLELLDKDNAIFTYCTPDSLQAKLYKIHKLSSQGIVPSASIQEEYLISSLVMEEAINSSQLEGASTTRKVAKEILVSEKKPKNKDEEMILNNYLLMQEVKRTKSESLTIDLILNFHAIATRNNTTNGNIAGEFRKSNEIIITDGVEENILHQPPDYNELESRLRRLCDFANKEHSGENETKFIDPVVKAVILHFMIGYDHPFADGNGRTSRAIFYWFILKNGYDYFEYISISKLLKEAPKQYSLAYLRSEIDDNDLTYFIYYQVEMVLRAIDELLIYLQKKSEEYEEVSSLLYGTTYARTLNFEQKDILQKAMKQPGRVFTANEVAVDYSIAANSARKYLNQLVKDKLLYQSKEGRTITYIAPAALRTIIEKAKV